MDNKKYLDKVIGSLVRGTRIDYDEEEIEYPFLSSYLPSDFPSYLYLSSHPFVFSEYCKNIYGLNEEEMEYVWEEYKKILIDKIENER